ncbi:MAG TPA: S1/P1 nuclease [Capsulimonadaceae bacterium]|jgi:hypothetical protein
MTVLTLGRRYTAALMLALAVLASASPATLAWGKDGHAIVADIAARQLSRAAAKHVATLLDGKSMASVSSWADDIRVWQKKPTGPPPDTLADDPVAAAFVAAAGNETQPSWHYADLPLGTLTYDPTGLGAGPNDIVHALNRCIAVLQTGRDPLPGGSIDPPQALRLVIHYVADIHQPLHAACGYWTAGPTGAVLEPLAMASKGVDDRGGNSIRYGRGKYDNLHALWDVHMVDVALAGRTPQDFITDAVADLRAGRVPAGTLPGKPADLPAKWIVDSAAQASAVYAGVDTTQVTIGPDSAFTGQAALSLTYDTDHKQLAVTQLARAGARLAALLNALWPG